MAGAWEGLKEMPRLIKTNKLFRQETPLAFNVYGRILLNL